MTARLTLPLRGMRAQKPEIDDRRTCRLHARAMLATRGGEGQEGAGVLAIMTMEDEGKRGTTHKSSSPSLSSHSMLSA